MTANDFILILKDGLTSVPFVLPVVLALVQWVKSVTGTNDERILNSVAMLFGLVFGGAFMLAVRMPETYPQWFAVAFFGVVLGLSASGLFKVGAQLATRAASVSTVATITAGTIMGRTEGLAPAEIAAAKTAVR